MSYTFQGVKVEFNGKVTKPVFTQNNNYLVLRYPCTDIAVCSPYKITLPRGNYLFECWGAKGATYSDATKPGLGAYTSGILKLREEKTFYVFVGATGYYNSIKNRKTSSGPQGSGGSTDVRLSSSTNWYDEKSLYTRIMVAAGGGSAEWLLSIGGNGGTLQGGQSISAKYGTSDSPVYDEPCKGASQTSSRDCPIYIDGFGSQVVPVRGGFGFAGNPQNGDEGGFGGNGYYGGTSYSWAFAGSGGSSFISGHQGCQAIKDPSKNNNQIIHKEDSIHYSGIYFSETKMIAGNQTMPLPSNIEGVWNEPNGAFRLSYIRPDPHTCKPSQSSKYLSFILLMFTSIIETKK